jgi:hypothetical protein
MHVAELKATSQGNRFSTEIGTTGLVGMMSNYKNVAETEFTVKNGIYTPTRFSKKSERTSGTKHTELGYNSGTVATQKSSEEQSSEALQAAGKIQAIDPLAAVIIARQRILKARTSGEKQFSFPLYDGKKLATLNFELFGTKELELDGKMEDTLHVRMTRIPLSGFDADENKNSVVELYLSNDIHLVPLFADAKASVGHATIVINKRCFPAEECA